MAKPPRASTRSQAALRTSPVSSTGIAKKIEKLLDPFDSCAVAIFSISCLLVACVSIYVWAHRKDPPISRVKTLFESIEFTSDGTMTPLYKDAVFERWFGRGELQSLKNRINEKAQIEAQQNARERRDLLGPLQELAQRGLGTSGPIRVVTSGGDQKTDVEWNSLQLPFVRDWLKDNIKLLAPDKTVDATRLLAALEAQIERENERKERLRSEVHVLDAALSFSWLLIDHSNWVWEVVAWTWFGVLANTLIALIHSSRDKNYKADEFVLVFPKLLLAPLLSVVCVALWSSGFTSAPVTFVNLPLFLVFSFSLGLVTEQLYDLLRSSARWLVERFLPIDQEKMAAAGRDEPYGFIHPLPTPSAPPSNLKQLAEELRARANAEIERGIVTRLSPNP